MRQILSVISVVLFATVLAGCTVQEASSSVSTAVMSPSVDATSCVNPSVTVDRTNAATWEFTAIRLRDAVASSIGGVGTALVDEPLSSSVSWDSDALWLDDDAVRELVAEKITLPAHSIGLTQVDDFLTSINDRHTVLGYGAIDVERPSIEIDCDNGLTAKGHVVTWQRTEVGAVVCGDASSAGKNKIAALAQKRYCS